MVKYEIDALALQETYVNTNSIEIHEGYRFIFATCISNKDREAALKTIKEHQNSMRARGRGGRGRGRGRQVNNLGLKATEFAGVCTRVSPHAWNKW